MMYYGATKRSDIRQIEEVTERADKWEMNGTITPLGAQQIDGVEGTN